jgi:tripartite-type tricarboxylate transporter receptor subunit TctC
MQSFIDYTGAILLHVPYQGSGPGFAAVLGGQVDSMMVPLGLAESNFKAGKIRILAVDTAQRYPSVPDVPTFIEQGVPLSFSFWQGVMAPAKTPDAVVSLINREVAALVQDPSVRAELLKVGMVAGTPGQNGVGVPPGEVRKYFDSEYERWGKTIRAGGIRSE